MDAMLGLFPTRGFARANGKRDSNLTSVLSPQGTSSLPTLYTTTTLRIPDSSISTCHIPCQAISNIIGHQKPPQSHIQPSHAQRASNFPSSHTSNHAHRIEEKERRRNVGAAARARPCASHERRQRTAQRRPTTTQHHASPRSCALGLPGPPVAAESEPDCK
jgi:hypothetical protein